MFVGYYTVLFTDYFYCKSTTAKELQVLESEVEASAGDLLGETRKNKENKNEQDE